MYKILKVLEWNDIYSKLNYAPFIFFQLIFTEHLPCVRHCMEGWGYGQPQDDLNLPPQGPEKGEFWVVVLIDALTFHILGFASSQ